MLLSLIAWIIVGFLAGFIAKALMPGADGGGFVVTTLLGIVGAVLGGYVGRMLFSAAADNTFSLVGFVFAIIGALIVLAIYRLATGRSLSY